jgi:hypothetical protein
VSLTINVNYHDFSAEQEAAFGRAVTTWQNILNSFVPVNVEAYWGVNLSLINGGRLIAMCVPNGTVNFGTGTVNTWYTSSLADKLNGANLQQGEPDMAVFFDNSFNWYTGTGNPAADQYDLESIALHEMCHGFGFLGLFWVNAAGGQGSYGNNNLLGVIPETVKNLLPFSLPDLKNYPSIYGRNIINKSFEYLTNPDNYSNESIELGNVLTNGLLKFYSVPSTTYQVYTYNPFLPFTSIEHLDPTAFPNSLMRPSIGMGQFIRFVDVPVQKILGILGW